MHFGKALHKELARRGWRHWWVAERMGITRSGFTQLLRHGNPRLSSIVAVASVLEMKPSEVLALAEAEPDDPRKI